MSNKPEPGMGFYVVVWIGLIIIAGIEVMLTYQHLPVRTLLASFLILSFIEAGLAVMYMMHLKFERPSLFWSLIPYTIFVLFMMDHVWADAFRAARLSLLK
jgi:cytochrome c oxidase subunit IV